MPEGLWMLIVLVLVAALVYGAYLLGRASALAEARRTSTALQADDAPETPARREQPRTASAPPPVMAGSHDGAVPPAQTASQGPRRSAAPPPAAAAGPAQSASAGSVQSAPKRTAAPPPAQAAWSNPKDGSSKGK